LNNNEESIFTWDNIFSCVILVKERYFHGFRRDSDRTECGTLSSKILLSWQRVF
jgi:hypothetical protein